LTRDDETKRSFINDSKRLVTVLSKLEYDELISVLKARKDEIFASLGAEGLTEVLVNLKIDDLSVALKILLIDEGNGILDFLLKNPQQLVTVLSMLK
jgi:hypothetical protein